MSLSSSLTNFLNKFSKFNIREWIDKQDKFYLMLVRPAEIEGTEKNYDYNTILFKEKFVTTSELINILMAIMNKEYRELNEIVGMHLDEISSYLSINDLEELNRKFKEEIPCYRTYFEGELPSRISPTINYPTSYIFYPISYGKEYPFRNTLLFHKDYPYYPSKISAVSNLMEIDLSSAMNLGKNVNPGLLFLLPFTNMYIKSFKIIGDKIELKYSDNNLLGQHRIKIYYERDNNNGETFQDEAKTEYSLDNFPTFLSLILYKKDSGQMVDKIDYKVMEPFISKRIEVLNTFEYISTLIKEGESETIEFKAYQNYNEIVMKKDDLLETVLSFSNSFGGTIIIGVKDDKTIIGFKDQTPFEKLKKDLSNLIDGNCEPLIRYHVEIVKSNKGENLLTIFIQMGIDPPYIKKFNNGIYVRINDADRGCSRVEFDQLVSKKI